MTKYNPCQYVRDIFHEGLQLTFRKAPIDKLLSDNQCMQRDFEKFQECIHNWEGRKKTLIGHVANLKADITQQCE